MIEDRGAPDLAASAVYDCSGTRLGTVGRVYVDAESGEPEFVTVDLGQFGSVRAVASLRGATARIGRVDLAFTADHVRAAPNGHEDGATIEVGAERRLREHYDS